MSGYICLIASTLFGSDMTSPEVYKLLKRQHLVSIIHFLKLSLFTALLVCPIASWRFLSYVFSLGYTYTSPGMPAAPLHFSYIWSIFLWKMSPFIFNPKGILMNVCLLKGVWKIVMYDDVASNFTFQFPSNLKKKPSVVSHNSDVNGSQVGTGWCSLLMALFQIYFI